VSWALNRQAERTRQLYEAKFGSVDTPIPQFTAGPTSQVYLLDLESILPGLRVELIDEPVAQLYMLRSVR
jgi:hypothetical protein